MENVRGLFFHGLGKKYVLVKVKFPSNLKTERDAMMKCSTKGFTDKWWEHLQRSRFTNCGGEKKWALTSPLKNTFVYQRKTPKAEFDVFLFIYFFPHFMSLSILGTCGPKLNFYRVLLFHVFWIRFSQKLWTSAVSISLRVVNMKQGWLQLQALCITRRKRKIIGGKDDSLSLADLGAFGSLMFPP